MGISDHINGLLGPPAEKPSAFQFYLIWTVIVAIPVLAGLYIGALIWAR